MLKLTTLGSSSKGNCYIIRTDDEILLLECGLKIKNILAALDFDLRAVAGCLLSHEHKDHSKSAGHLAEKGINVYSSKGTLESLGINHHRVIEVKPKQQFKVGGFTVLPFDVKHDAAEPLGYLIQHPEFGKLLFATDTYYVKYRFPKLNYVLIECNYSIDILNENVKNGRVDGFLKRRLLSSHFSLENVKKFFKANDLSQLREIGLIHLSEANSNAEQFQSEIQKLTGVPVKALADKENSLLAAKTNEGSR